MIIEIRQKTGFGEWGRLLRSAAKSLGYEQPINDSEIEHLHWFKISPDLAAEMFVDEMECYKNKTRRTSAG